MLEVDVGRKNVKISHFSLEKFSFKNSWTCLMNMYCKKLPHLHNLINLTYLETYYWTNLIKPDPSNTSDWSI